jgi:dolichol-phosphate mannosyltransferase
MKTLSIIIPCYNEENTIEILLNKILNIEIPKWNKEIVVVDDGSKDKTREILGKYVDVFKIVFHEKNKGKGTAVKTGLEHANGDYILIQDADLEYNPEEIIHLIKALEENRGQVIYGSRNLHHIKRKGMLIPRAGVWFITKQFNILYGSKLTDLWTCYKLFPKDVKHLFVSGKFESELIFSAELAKRGHKIAEVPISHKPRSFKEGKKIRYRDGIIGIYHLLRVYFK